MLRWNDLKTYVAKTMPGTLQQPRLENKRKLEFAEIQRRQADFYKLPTRVLIKHLQKEYGYSLSKIANIEGFPFSRKAIQQNYLKENRTTSNSSV